MRPFLAHRGWEPRSKEGLDSGSVGVEGLAARGKPRVGAPGENSGSGAGAVAARARDRDGTRPTVATEMSHRGCENLTHRAVPFGLDASPEALLVYISEWHRQALPAIHTKEVEHTELSFWQAWEN